MPKQAQQQETSVLRFSMYTLGGVAAVAVTIFIWHQVDRFLISDPRFVLTSEDDPSPGVRLHGVHYASAERIHEVFHRDEGRTVYRLPLAERRRNLLALEWVKDATVSRVWPNNVSVIISERRPVAFVLLPRRGENPAMLVDEDGVLLPLRDSAKFHLPVVRGLRTEQSEEDRKTRIRRMLRLQSEIGGHIDRISEVDVADADNLKVTYPMSDRAMILYLGHTHYALRLKKFLENADEIRRRLPNARALDLRLEDRITAVQEEEEGRRGA